MRIGQQKTVCRGLWVALALLLTLASSWMFFQHAADAMALYAVTLLVIGVVLLNTLAEASNR